MKHIVFVIGNYKNGGVPMRSTNLANEFGKRGYRVTILVTKDIGKDVFFTLHKNVMLVSLKDYVEDNKYNFEVVRDAKKIQKRLRFLKRISYFLKSNCRLKNKIRDIRVSETLRVFTVLNRDAVYIPFGLSYFEETVCAVSGLSAKVIYAERNAPEVEVPKDKERAKRLLTLLKKADGGVFQTVDEQSYYEEYLNKNTAVIHNPIKVNLPAPFSGERRNVIVNYCRISPQKNIYLMIDAFKKLLRDYPLYHLEIYGNAVEESEELLKNEVIRYVQDKGVSESIHILPPCADVHERVKDCAMFVSSSDFEGLSNSMIEAMAIGLPCVCTDCLGGGAREVIKHEENGLLVPMKDEEALYKAIKRFIEDQKLAQKCGKNAAKIRESQSVENIATKWLEVIERV